MPDGNTMSNGPPPAQPEDAVDARWLFPQERAPSPPRDEGCEHNGFGDPALLSSNGPQPTCRRGPKVLRRVSRILNKEGLHFANLFYIFE